MSVAHSEGTVNNHMTIASTAADYGGELLSASIRRLLLERILKGQYQPGARIVELQLSKELGVSQSPIREALRDLAAAGIVTMQPRRGARVHRPSAKDLADVSVVRGEVDALAARLATEIISPATLDALEGLIDEMVAAFEAGDFLAATDADVRFHQLILMATDNKPLERAFDQLAPFGRTFITLTLPDVDVREILLEHREILNALRAGDAERAANSARMHQQNVRNLLGAHYPPSEVSGATKAP